MVRLSLVPSPSEWGSTGRGWHKLRMIPGSAQGQAEGFGAPRGQWEVSLPMAGL